MAAHPGQRNLLIDIMAGSLIGGLVGLIAAWNLAILLGVEGGYQASVGDAFDHSLFAGILVTAALVSGPLSGVWVARRQRRKREAAGRVPISRAD